MKRYTLDEAMGIGKSFNLNLLRFVAAIMVIISHAYPLSLGAEFADPIVGFSGGSLGLGGIAVGVFFLSSGLLVSKSIHRSNNGVSYFKARMKRIFPPLICIVFVTVFILGVILTDNTLKEYFTNSKTYMYLLNAILIPIHDLPGVFTNNIYGAVINGALWTLPIEFLCYIALFVCYKLNLLNKKNLKFTIPVAILSFICVYYLPIPFFASINNYVLPIFIFYIGMIFYVYKEQVVIHIPYAILCSLFFVLLVYFGFSEIAMVLLFPYIILVLIYNKKQCSQKLASLGDYSYSIYLCGFPIQQVIVYLFDGHMNVGVNAILSSLLAIGFGYLLFLIAEKPFLAKKQ